MAGMAETFAKALQDAEKTRDPAPLVALFTEDAELANLTHRERGTHGARAFWDTYLGQFDAIGSTFRKVIESNGAAALVWDSEGSLRGGRPISYSGVSVLELDGDRVRRFQTWYDPAPFLTPADDGSGTAFTDR